MVLVFQGSSAVVGIGIELFFLLGEGEGEGEEGALVH